MRNLTKRTLVRALSEIQPSITDKFGGLRTEFEVLFRECDSLKDFATTYNTKYIVETQRRHKDFFGPLNLNDEQVVAVIKDDQHNLVIAPQVPERLGFLQPESPSSGEWERIPVKS